MAWSPASRAGSVVHRALRVLAWVVLAVLVFGFLPDSLVELVRRLP